MAGGLRARHSSLCLRRSDRCARAGSREGPRELSMQPLNKAVMSLKSSAHPGLGVFLILGDPGAVSRVDKMFVVKVFCKIETSSSRSYRKL